MLSALCTLKVQCKVPFKKQLRSKVWYEVRVVVLITRLFVCFLAAVVVGAALRPSGPTGGLRRQVEGAWVFVVTREFCLCRF